MSPLIQDLQRRISIASEIEAACLRAELALHLGRNGEDVAGELAALRAINVRIGDPRLSIWIHIANGVFELTKGNFDLAIQQLERATAVAKAVNLVRERTVVDSWLAYYAYVHNDIFGMIDKVRLVLSAIDHADKIAVGRSQMLVAQSFHFAGRFDRARPWYDSAKMIASETGDYGLRSALLFNIASHHVSNYRHHVLRGSPASMCLDLLSAISESVKNYDELVGVTSLRAYESTLFASVHLLHGRFDLALTLFESSLASARESGLARIAPLYEAEMALCAASLADFSTARCHLDSALSSVSADVHVDDRAATYGRAYQVFNILGEDDIGRNYMECSEREWVEHEEFQKLILDRLFDKIEGKFLPA